MQTASRACVLAAAAVAATSAVVLTPATTKAVRVPVRDMQVKLVDFTDVPINLFDDVVNIPYNEFAGIDVLGNSLLFSGDWWVPSATNIWGTDPGDLGHYMGILDTLLPFAPQISGLDQPEIDPIADANGTAGLAQQIGLLAAAELPTSSSCDAEACAPMTPPEIITGNTGLDRDIGFLEALGGHGTDANGEPFSLFSNWLQVPLSDLTSGNFTFTPATDPGLLDPSPDVGPDAPGVTGSLGFDGTTGVDGTGAGDYMPWAGDTFQLNLFGPFEDFYNSLFQAPTGGIDGTGIDLPSLTDIGQSLQNLTAGAVVAFDPFVAGSPACPALCDIPAGTTQLDLLKDVLALDPSNTSLANYVGDFADQNNATIPQINDAVALLQTGSYNFSPTELAQVDQALANINPELPALYTNEGILTDPNYLTYLSDPTAAGITNSSGELVGEYGGYNYMLVGDDLLKLAETSFSGYQDPTLLTDLQTLATDFTFPGDPSALASLLGEGAASTAAGSVDPTGVATDLTSVLGGFDPTALTTDLSSLLASLGTGVGSDALTQLLTDFSTQVAADFAPQLATDLATLVPSMF
ncbi:hypothetical protein [Mycobacterium paraterrae]|uniref:PE-PPE domain-containing protein n=1 Tax=Mycobacterium paraterrae TaxID=577492 RepID=A0ABY3VP47_9MYCO|nr:hypothetical protein [Mycobacterium paraterrae]UMB70957.1 hypothetical protein MKK62_06645 [Mycobacterium paraterrae]